MAKLGEVCLLKAGKFVSANDISPEYNKGLYPCFGGNGIRGYVADYTHDGEFPLIGRQGALCGNVNLASGKFHATEHAVVVQPKIEMNVHWLYYALNAMNLGQYATGAAQPGLAVSKLETLSIEIPNISEQNKIAQTLYKVEQLVNFRKQQLAKLDELVKARFVEMFGEPVSNPYKFEVRSLQNMLDDGIITYHLDGNHGSDYPRNEEFVESGVSYISANCIIDDTVNLNLAKHLTEERAAKLRKGIAQDEDVLFAHNATVGPVAILHTRETKVILGTSLTAYRCNKQRILPAYLKAYMQSEGFVRQYTKDMKQTTRNQVPITAQRKYLFIVPPLSLQNQFAAFVERVDQQKQTVQQSLEKLELMKKALMQEYFG